MAHGVKARRLSFSALLSFASLMAAPAPAYADADERALGLAADGANFGGRVQAAGEVGITDWIATRVWLGLEHVDEFAGVGHWEVFAQLDALKWVPEISMGLGLSLGDGFDEPRILGNLGARHYLDFDRSILIRAGAEWRPDRWLAAVSVGYWWHWQ